MKRLVNKNYKGMSLIEVTIAGSMMALLGLASMKLAENNSKTQKKMNFNSQLSQLKLTTNIQLRKGESCLKNLSGDSSTTESFEIKDGIDSPTPENCKTQGTQRDVLYDQKGKIFLQKGEVYGKESGAAFTVRDIRTALPKMLPGNAVVCVKVELNGAQTLGSKEMWISEVLDLQGAANTNTVNSCNAESVADAEDSCKTFNGKLNEGLGCEGLNVGYPGSEIIKNSSDYVDSGDNNFKDKRITDAAINALGNLGVSKNLHVCGNISVGTMSDGSFPIANDMQGCGSSSIYTNSLMSESIITKTLVTENLNASGSIKLSGNATLDSLNVNGNTTISGDLDVKGQTSFLKAIKTNNGIDNSGKNIFTKTLDIDGNLIYADQKTNTIYLNAKVKAKHHDGTYTGLDSLVTHSWVYENLFTKMSDQAINELLRTIFDKISSDSWSASSSLNLVKDFVKDRLTIEKKGEMANYSSLTSHPDSLVAGSDYCQNGYSIGHIEFQSNDPSNNNALPGKLKYYCKPEAAFNIDDNENINLRAVSGGQLFNSWHLSKIANTLPCRDYNRTDKILQQGEYCWTPRINMGYYFGEVTTDTNWIDDQDSIQLWIINFFTGDFPTGYVNATDYNLLNFYKYKKDGYRSGNGLGYMTTACVKMDLKSSVFNNTPWKWYQCNLADHGSVTEFTGCCGGNTTASATYWNNFITNFKGTQEKGVLVSIWQRVK